MLIHTEISPQPQLSKSIFWDTDIQSLDFDRHACFVITRVFERGRKSDQQAILNYYGEHEIINTLKKANSLLPIAKERAKQLFQLSDQDFTCYTSKPQIRNFSRF
jgi:hypothetical protein